jgi:putative methyltransferase (TIGR04325 family)
VHWRVVEQQAFVKAGQAEFSTAELQFFGSVAEMPESSGGRVILLSSVLQYLPEPAGTLDSLLATSARHVVIDRTPLSQADADRLCIQHVPKQIYAASYPCWILSRSRLLAQFPAPWRVVAEFPCAEGAARTEDGLPFEFRGLILERKT